MPLKPLPKKLIARLEKVISAHSVRRHGRQDGIYAALGRMENIDHRKPGYQYCPKDTVHWGGRIRQMNVSRNFSGVELALKRTHEVSAKKNYFSHQKNCQKA